MNDFQWIQLAMFFFLIVIQITIREEKDTDLRIFLVLVLILFMFGVSFLANDLKHPLGVNEMPQGEILKVLAVDTTNNAYINMITVDGNKKTYTYAVYKEKFEKTPKQGDLIGLISINGKEIIISR